MDLPRAVSLGPVTLAGALTLLTAILAVVQLLFIPVAVQGQKVPASLVPLWIFAALALGGLAIAASSGSLNPAGLQNTAVYVAFVGIATAAAFYKHPHRTWFYLRRAALVVAYLVPINSGLGLGLVSDRPSSIAAVLAIAILIPGKPNSVLERLAPYVAAFGCLLTLSRTSTVIAALLLAFVVLRGKAGWRAVRGLTLLAVCLGGIWLLVTQYAPLRDRFLVGDSAVQINGLALSTQGRASFWEALIANMDPAELIGKGAGAAEALIARTSPGQSHPHNEYLRILYDFGPMGVILFLMPIVGLTIAAVIRGHRTNHQIHWAAALSGGAILALAITDNPLVYIFVMAPLAAVLGSSAHLAHANRDHDPTLGPLAHE